MNAPESRHAALGIPVFVAATALLVAVWSTGCAPAHYRKDADLETYAILAEKAGDPRWVIPAQAITPPPESRMHDPDDPDNPAMPPDDETAHQFMHCVDGQAGYGGWHAAGDAFGVESPQWQTYLDLEPDGRLEISPDRAAELALLHSREYQTRLEELYLTALALSLERFDFRLQWFGGNGTHYDHLGTSSVPNESNTLSTASRLGFTKSLSAGGQLLVEFANSFVWEFTGTDVSSSASNITIDFIQPLLRRAAREVRLEDLTQAEREVLYEVRDFARFRKEFYVDIVASNRGLLELYRQLQNIRNLESNLVNLERSLEEHEAFARAGIISNVQVDQVFLNYQLARQVLIQSQVDYETALDFYKIKLGLPSTLELHLQDDLLTPFMLTEPALAALEQEMAQHLASYREREDAPPFEDLVVGYGELEQLLAKATMLAEQVGEELADWKSGPVALDRDPASERERAVRTRASDRHHDLMQDLSSLQRDIVQAKAGLDERGRDEGWKELQDFGRRALAGTGDISLIQTQVRVYLIDLEDVEIEAPDAIGFALVNRLDLMNTRSRVIDGWRQIKVSADALEAALDLVFAADISTLPGGNNPVRFRSAASRYRVGIKFDSPLNRKAERNIYRAELVNYQRTRRAYMASEDQVARSIRRNLRQLEADSVSFEIARQSLIAAARQIRGARLQLLAPGQAGDASTTLFVLDALSSLVQAKNGLVNAWTNYEIGRAELMLNMEALQFDDQGIHLHEYGLRNSDLSGNPE